MLKNVRTFSSFSVPDLGEAKRFYDETLGLNIKERPEGLELPIGSDSHVFIYVSPNNKPADFTILNFLVDDIENAVSELTKKGVRMESYDMPGIKTDERGIARSGHGSEAMAWFKDPAGNILSLMQEK